MRRLVVRSFVVAASLACAPLAFAPMSAAAQKPAKAAKVSNSMAMPRTATARCSDSTWSKAASQQGACSAHGGVAKWFGTAPKGYTGRCKDGEYWTTEEQRGACSAHGGVAYWNKKAKAKKAS